MAAKKKRARKSNAKHARKARAKNPAKRVRGRARAKNPTHRRRHHNRRRNPGADMEGSFAAIAGGVVGRLARGAATTAADMALAPKGHGKQSHGASRGLSHGAAALVPGVVGHFLREKHPNLGAGMLGATGAGLVDVGGAHFGPDKHGRPPSWMKWALGPGSDHMELPSGAVIHAHPETGQPMLTPPPPPGGGEMGPPAPVIAVQGPAFTLRTVSGDRYTDRHMRAVAQLPGNEVLAMEPSTKRFETIGGIVSLSELRGIVEVKGIVSVT